MNGENIVDREVVYIIADTSVVLRGILFGNSNALASREGDNGFLPVRGTAINATTHTGLTGHSNDSYGDGLHSVNLFNCSTDLKLIGALSDGKYVLVLRVQEGRFLGHYGFLDDATNCFRHDDRRS